jgi:hypothetical protein
MEVSFVLISTLSENRPGIELKYKRNNLNTNDPNIIKRDRFSILISLENSRKTLGRPVITGHSPPPDEAADCLQSLQLLSFVLFMSQKKKKSDIRPLSQFGTSLFNSLPKHEAASTEEVSRNITQGESTSHSNKKRSKIKYMPSQSI